MRPMPSGPTDIASSSITPWSRSAGTAARGRRHSAAASMRTGRRRWTLRPTPTPIRSCRGRWDDETPEHLIRDHGDGVDLDEIVGRRHLADLDHGRRRCRRLEIFAPDFVDLVEMLHVADVDIDRADIVHRAAGLLDRGLEILADLPRLHLDIADAGNRAVGPPRRHP